MKKEAWDARLKKYRPDDLPELAAALIPMGRAAVEYRLPLLHAKCGNDARLAEVLAGWVERRPAGFQGQPTDAFWKMVLRVLKELGDGRQRPRLIAVKAQVDAAIGCHADTVLRAGLGDVIAALPVVEVPVRAAVDRTPLFAAVYADPDSDVPRAVLADALLSDGDPRGELIALQLQGKKGTKLVAAHGVAWTGKLAPAVRKEGLTYARGFPQSLHLGPTPAALDLAACEELATVETLHVAGGLALPEGMWPRLRSLKVLTGHVFAALSASLPRLETLELHGSVEGERIAACVGMPKLNRLWVESMLHGPERLPLWPAPLGKTLTRVYLASVFGTAGEWRAWMQAAPPQVIELSAGLVTAAMRLTMTRGWDGWNAVVLINTHGNSVAGGVEAVDEALDAAGDALAGSGLARCELVLRPNTRGPGWPATHLPPSEAAIARLKARLPGAVVRA